MSKYHVSQIPLIADEAVYFVSGKNSPQSHSRVYLLWRNRSTELSSPCSAEFSSVQQFRTMFCLLSSKHFELTVSFHSIIFSINSDR